MEKKNKIKVIVNPASARGNTAKLWPELQKALQQKIGKFDMDFTKRQGHATEITRESLKQGYSWIISVGGDGTLNEVINGFFVGGKNIYSKACFSVIGTGTGGDFKKSLQKLYDISDLLKREGDSFIEKNIDVGRIVSPYGERYFINITSIGMGGLVVELINRDKILKIFGGKIAYYVYTLFTLLTFQNKVLSIVLDKNQIVNVPVKNMAVANGRYQGGGMLMAPDADMEDGLFDIIIFGDMGIWETLMLTGKIYTGEHIHHKKVQVFRAKIIDIKYKGHLPLDVDGEKFASTPALISVLPKSLKIRM